MAQSVVFFCMPDRGHFQRLRALIRGLSAESVRVHVYTHARFRREVEQEGGTFVNLFAKYSLEEADNESWPEPCRFVSYAACYAEQISKDVRTLRASLIVHDTFAVVGGVVARILGLPHVNVCAGHAVVPERFLAIMRALPIVQVSPACGAAVEVLATRYGMRDASPFSYLSALSEHLNLYCEPPQFLDEADRAPFEPIAFYGSLPFRPRLPPRLGPESLFGDAPKDCLNVYASFGTVVWGYRRSEALAALRTLADAFEADPAVRVLISLGGHWDSALATHLTRRNVRVESYVDQWQLLRDTDVFVTHHGLNSTHEAIFHEVPMLSYPFVFDQPGQALKCQQLDLAVPLGESVMGSIRADDVSGAMQRMRDGRDRMSSALGRARGWEDAVLADRPAVHQRLLDLRA